jgi:hypothetical protein
MVLVCSPLELAENKGLGVATDVDGKLTGTRVMMSIKA